MNKLILPLLALCVSTGAMADNLRCSGDQNGDHFSAGRNTPTHYNGVTDDKEPGTQAPLTDEVQLVQGPVGVGQPLATFDIYFKDFICTVQLPTNDPGNFSANLYCPANPEGFQSEVWQCHFEQ